MCRGNRLVADFVAGTSARPGLPGELDEYLTMTVNGLWVVWAHKLARQAGNLFVPLTRGLGYPADARAECRARGFRETHHAPDPACTCGFHALSSRRLPGLPVRGDLRALTVALSGRCWPWSGLATGCCGGQSGRPWSASSGRPRSTRWNQLRASATPAIPTAAPLPSPLPHLAIRSRCG
jgi:hypothetical protein